MTAVSKHARTSPAHLRAIAGEIVRLADWVRGWQSIDNSDLTLHERAEDLRTETRAAARIVDLIDEARHLLERPRHPRLRQAHLDEVTVAINWAMSAFTRSPALWSRAMASIAAWTRAAVELNEAE